VRGPEWAGLACVLMGLAPDLPLRAHKGAPGVFHFPWHCQALRFAFPRLRELPCSGDGMDYSGGSAMSLSVAARSRGQWLLRW
jgi:hypothetical protein